MSSRGKGSAQPRRPGAPDRPRVVILGGGYGGIYTALGLERAARAGKIDLSLISRDNFFLFQPMLSEVVSGKIEPPHIVNPIRRLCRHTNDAPYLRGRDLVAEVVGHTSFTQALFLHVTGRAAGQAETAPSPRFWARSASARTSCAASPSSRAPPARSRISPTSGNGPSPATSGGPPTRAYPMRKNMEGAPPD